MQKYLAIVFVWLAKFIVIFYYLGIKPIIAFSDLYDLLTGKDILESFTELL